MSPWSDALQSIALICALIVSILNSLSIKNLAKEIKR